MDLCVRVGGASVDVALEVEDRRVSAYLERFPATRLAALGHAPNLPHLDPRPLGLVVERLAAEDHPSWVARYEEANRSVFSGPLALPGWVLVDVFLLPGAISLVLEDDQVIAAWVGLPTVCPGVVNGISLLSTRPGTGAGYVAKRLGLALQRATAQRGVTQWDNRAVALHAALGAVRVVSAAPGGHSLQDRSFVYEGRLGAALPDGEDGPYDPQAGRQYAAWVAAGESVSIGYRPGVPGLRWSRAGGGSRTA